jgi:hypothetical protein
MDRDKRQVRALSFGGRICCRIKEGRAGKKEVRKGKDFF